MLNPWLKMSIFFNRATVDPLANRRACYLCCISLAIQMWKYYDQEYIGRSESSQKSFNNGSSGHADSAALRIIPAFQSNSHCHPWNMPLRNLNSRAWDAQQIQVQKRKRGGHKNVSSLLTLCWRFCLHSKRHLQRSDAVSQHLWGRADVPRVKWKMVDCCCVLRVINLFVFLQR